MPRNSDADNRTRRFPENRVCVCLQPTEDTGAVTAADDQQIGLQVSGCVANGSWHVSEFDMHFTVHLQVLLKMHDVLLGGLFQLVRLATAFGPFRQFFLAHPRS